VAVLCEAAAMDAAYFGNWEASADWVPPCDEPASVDIHGYELCDGCAEALEVLGGLHSLRTREGRLETTRMLLIMRVSRFLFESCLMLTSAVAMTYVLIVLRAWVGV
jgi:hypothetical protein